jgi:RNA polymerase sigma factor (sigma-70 family)
MPTSPLSVVLQHLLADVGPDGRGMADGELLARFLRSRDHDAFAALVRRHAPMVWGVCRRLLHNHQDAEDAFQATFLVLVRRAADVPRRAVANWLYGVARQTAVRLRATAAKRGRRETQVVTMPEPTVAEVRDADQQSVLDEELSRLPHHYRGVVVLCDLEGMTRKKAARQLGIPEGSVASRLARARVLLAKRLTRRGVVLSGGAVAAVLSAGSASASAPPALVASTIKAASLLAAGRAAGVVSARVAALAKGVSKAMFLNKLRVVVGVLMLVFLLGIGAAVSLGQQQDSPKKAEPEANQGEGKEATVKAMQARLQGTWKCVSMHCGGVKSEPDMTCTIKGNAWETKLDGRVYQSGTFKLVDLDANPKQIEWAITFAEAEEDKDKTCHGIFMLDGASLCWVASDAAKYPRPQSFFTQQDGGCCAGMFKRADPKQER